MTRTNKVLANHICPRCGRSTGKTVDSRSVNIDGVKRRRRYRCTTCNHKWNTLEIEVDGSAQSRVAVFLDRVDRAARDVFGDDARGWTRFRE